MSGAAASGDDDAGEWARQTVSSIAGKIRGMRCRREATVEHPGYLETDDPAISHMLPAKKPGVAGSDRG